MYDNIHLLVWQSKTNLCHWLRKAEPHHHADAAAAQTMELGKAGRRGGICGLALPCRCRGPSAGVLLCLLRPRPWLSWPPDAQRLAGDKSTQRRLLLARRGRRTRKRLCSAWSDCLCAAAARVSRVDLEGERNGRKGREESTSPREGDR